MSTTTTETTAADTQAQAEAEDRVATVAEILARSAAGERLTDSELAIVHRHAGRCAARYDRANAYPHGHNRGRLMGFAGWRDGYEAGWAEYEGIALAPAAANELARGWRTARNTEATIWAAHTATAT